MHRNETNVKIKSFRLGGYVSVSVPYPAKLYKRREWCLTWVIYAIHKFGASQGAIYVFFSVATQRYSPQMIGSLWTTLIFFSPHLHIICSLFSVVVFAGIAGNAMANDQEPIWNYWIKSILHTFWLALSSDLLKDRHIDDDSTRFEIKSELITICCRICKETNKFASFCIDNNLHQMAISKVCQSGKRVRLTCFLIKTSNILYDLSVFYLQYNK